MNVYISAEAEGLAGIVDWEQCVPGDRRYNAGCEIMLGEVNAAVEGAVAAGATEILVNDAHSSMMNLPTDRLSPKTEYLSGRFKMDFMMEGLDSTFDSVFYVGYHASASTSSTLSHTYNLDNIEVRLNGHVVGECGINALAALAYGVAISLLSGDQYSIAEAQQWIPGAEFVQVKESVGRNAARNLHPTKVRQLLSEAAERALAREHPLPAIEMPATIEIDFRLQDMAKWVSRVDGWEQIGVRTVRRSDADALSLYRSYLLVHFLCRAIPPVQ